MNNREEKEFKIREIFKKLSHVDKTIVGHAVQMHGIVSSDIDSAIVQFNNDDFDLFYEDFMIEFGNIKSRYR
jgi:hypothetical protein